MSLGPVSPPVNGPVGPLERGLAVLCELTRLAAHRGEAAVRPGDLVRGTGLARSVVDRVVGTLEQLGYVRLDGRDVSLATRLMELGNAYLAASGLPDALGPFAERLADGLDESVSVAVPDGDGARFVVQATRRRTMSLAFRIGDLLPAERCAPGALFAAEWDERAWAAWRARRAADPLDAAFPAVPPRHRPAADTGFEARVREAARTGWAADDQLIEPGLVAVSVPVQDGSGRTVCAVNVVSHTSRHDVASLRAAVLGPLRAEVPAMEAALASPPARRRPPEAGPAAPEAGPDAQDPVAGPGAEDPARAAKRELGAGYLQSLARGLTVLRALGTPGEGEEGDGARHGRTLTAVAEITGLPRATARRSLLTLVELGYAEYAEADGRVFRPLPRVLELGYAPLGDLSFTELAQPHMRELVRTVHESASLAVLDGADIRYVARVPTVRIMSVNITIGTRFPAYATSMGRVLLAGLDPGERAAYLAGLDPTPLTRHTVTAVPELARVLERTGRDGYALVDEELEEGLRSLAVPVRDADRQVVAALNIATHAGRGSAEAAVKELLPALRTAAARIEADLATASAHHPLGAGERVGA
ncbi:IclR family transcriptional regulator C-terminal domain-containing protein [Streptomyces sp. Rer75]|uniref:IclR family transcriptional regulator domain-containing protein n=1 Tax=Streptomyces sp. Rer75 TaxID=2750011 RepID=UPI0015D0AD35|nr:IclR family transcriptional regulator C-terminal domain-containing protein [Streptomyces sp. Rer75]QLH24681.1 helix-turn-helix domain-containing protein [Streptomyces sp. Rer75]